MTDGNTKGAGQTSFSVAKPRDRSVKAAFGGGGGGSRGSKYDLKEGAKEFIEGLIRDHPDGWVEIDIEEATQFFRDWDPTQDTEGQAKYSSWKANDTSLWKNGLQCWKSASDGIFRFGLFTKEEYEAKLRAKAKRKAELEAKKAAAKKAAADKAEAAKVEGAEADKKVKKDAKTPAL